MNVDLEQTKNNIHYKNCNTTYNERLKEMVDENKVSLRGLKDNAKVFDELVLDINSDYFEKHGGYDFAKKFYEEAYHFAEKEYGTDNIISAVMHADEQNIALTEEYGKPILIKSYRLLQDRFYKYMSDNGFKDFIRGEKGSTSEHLTNLEFKAKKEQEKLQEITDKVKVQQVKFSENTFAIEETEKQINQTQQELDKIKKDVNDYKSYKGDIDNIDVGKSQLFGKKVELNTNDYQNLVKYAKKGVIADVEITKLKDENSKLKHDFNELIERLEILSMQLHMLQLK